MAKLLLILAIAGGCYGFYYYHTHPKNIADAIANANNTKDTVVKETAVQVDVAVKSAIAGVDKVSPIYYYQNRSYGASATKNICYDTSSSTSIGAIIRDVEKYTKAVSCRVDTSFPAKSFTIVAPSFANKGQYYCTDQSGFVGLIPDVARSTTFKAGFACK